MCHSRIEDVVVIETHVYNSWGWICIVESFIEEVCQIIRTHHDHIDNPSMPFRVLYDSDKLVMFSPEEFPYYNSIADFDWNKIVNLMYSEHMRQLAKEMLKQRQKEVT